MKNSIKKAICLCMSLAMVFSVFGICAVAETSPQTNDYYVQYGGTGDGRTPEAPAHSVHMAIQALNDDGLDADDTANIYIMESDSSGMTASSHTVTPWVMTGDPLVTHTAKIVVQGYEGQQWLAFQAGQVTSSLDLCGPTTMDNLKLYRLVGSYGTIFAHGYNLTLGNNMKYYKYDDGLKECYAPTISTTKYIEDDHIYTEQTVTYQSSGIAEGKLYVASNNYGGFARVQDLNIVLDNPNIGQSGSEFLIYFGTENYGHYFNKNLNITVKDASHIGFRALGSTNIRVDGGLQFLTKSGVQYDGEGVPTTLAGALSRVSSLTAENIWTLTADEPDKLSFTDTAGKYIVADGSEAVATNMSSNAITKSQGGILTLDAGDYTIKFTKSHSYYVQYGGTGDGRTPETPARSVHWAIQSLNQDGLGANDTASIYIMESDPNGMTGSSHTVTPWVMDGDPLVAHTAKIVVQGYKGQQWLAFHATQGSKPLDLCGPTVMDNLNLYRLVGSYGTIYAHSYDFTLGSNMKYYKYEDGLRECYAPMISSTENQERGHIYTEQTITYQSSGIAEGTLYVASDNYGGYARVQDLNVVLDNPNIGQPGNEFSIILGTGYLGHYFNKNLNITVKDANHIGFHALAYQGTNIRVDGGFQILTKSGVRYNGDGVSNTTLANAVSSVSSLTAAGGIWTLTTDDTDMLSFTETAGTYKVADGYTAIAVRNSDSARYNSANGILEIPQGDYTISFAQNTSGDYADYIFTRGSGLKNTYSKLTTGDKTLNVVYFGGSVTVGYGGPGFDGTKCWRSLVGNWLQNNFPQATVNNINCGCGESGTLLGSYRLSKDVISQKPDLLFLEYSINDKYDNAGYNRASYQFETIVRNIKEQLPTCDIVTVLVTDYDKANAARKVNGSKLHEEAQAHEDICKAYNIPSLHVGRALADKLPNNFSYQQWLTVCGAYDTVHLLEGGNKVYFDVIQQYLNSELLESSYDGSTVNATLPELQNDHLLDGNITFIQPSTALAERSIELGGQGVGCAHDTAFPLDGYDDFFVFSYDSENPTHSLAVEFDGTELIGILHNYNDVRNGASNRTYTISIDGGEPSTHNFYHMNPTVFITGLESGHHVAKIEVDVADSSNWLWLGALFSRDEDKQTTKGSDFSKKYINKNFGVECADILDDPNKTGLRFVFDIKKDFMNEIPNDAEYGAIFLPSDTAAGRELFLDTPIVTEWQFDTQTYSVFTPLTTGAAPTKVVFQNILQETNTDLKYSLCLTDISPEKYATFYTVRGYIKYINKNGVTRVVYTDDFQSSLYKAAAEMPEKTAIENAIINYAEVDRINNYFANNEVQDVYCGVSGCADANPNHKIYSLKNGLIVREANLKGFADTEKTEIAFLADPHFNYMNEQDILEKNPNVLASYISRSWLRDGSALPTVQAAIEYASMFKKTVVGGDAVDYLSKGSLAMTKSLFSARSVNGSIKMVIGNHETMENCAYNVPAIAAAKYPVQNKYTLDQRLEIVQQYWTDNDVNFDYEIMKKSDGVTDNLMLIYMNNAVNYYTQEQLAQLQGALAEARTKNVPVLIFQHNPMRTWNPNEQHVYCHGENGQWKDKISFATAQDYAYEYDYYNGNSYIVGSSSSDAATQQACTLIRKNYDIIKGVFCGHMHGHSYTEIVGLNEDGSTAVDDSGNPCVIPQHIQFGVHYNGVMKITIE